MYDRASHTRKQRPFKTRPAAIQLSILNALHIL